MSAKSIRKKLDNLLLLLCQKNAEVPAMAKKHQWKLLIGFLSVFVVLAIGIPKIQMDQSMDAFFQENASVLTSYQSFKKVFGSDEVQVILYKSLDPNRDIFHPETLRMLKNIEDQINRLRQKENHPLYRVTRVRSIISANILENKNDSLISRSFIGNNLPKTDEESAIIRKRAFAEKDFKGNFFSADGKIGLLILSTDYGSKEIFSDELAKDRKDTNVVQGDFDFGDEGISEVVTFADRRVDNLERQNMAIYHPFINAIEQILIENNFSIDKKISEDLVDGEDPKFHAVLMGNPWVMDYFMKILIKELWMFIVICFVIILLTLFLSFGAYNTLVWPGLIIAFNILGTLGFIGWIGAQVTMMINIVAFLIVTIGVSTAIHIYSGFYHNLREGFSKDEALKNAYYHSGLSIAFANLTTIVGMMALTTVPIVPIANFGWFASIGVAFSYVATIFLLPCLINIWSSTPDSIKIGGARAKINKQLRVYLIKMANYGIYNKKKVMAIFSFLVMFALLGLPKVTINTNFVKMIKDGNGLSEAYALVDEHFGGTGNVEIIIDTSKTNGVYDPILLNAMDKFETKVKKDYPEFVKKTNSLVKLAKDSHQKLTDGSEENYKIARSVDLSTQVLSLFESADPESRQLFVDDNWQIARITLEGVSKSTNEYNGFITNMQKDIDQILLSLKEKFPQLTVTVTGGIPMAMELLDFVAISQFRSFFVALASICIVLIFIYGSVKFGLVALIPNLFPILAILGYAGHAGIPFDSDTLLVIPIAIGIVVDDTIHFLTHFRTKLLEGLPKNEAILSAAKDVGQAMTMTSIVLTIGFLVFLFSVYVPFVNFGKLAAIGISTAFFSDLILLPAVLMFFNVFGEKNDAISK
jgi:uncharacterized protein